MLEPVPLVSVVVPNYNHEKYLPQRIESILNQTFTDFELIILDDCSADNSLEVIGKYAAADARIRVLANSKNSGSVFKQWKKGVAEARGQYLWVAESDDYAAPDFLDKLLAIIEPQPTVALAYADSVIVDATGQPSGYMSTWKNERYRTARWNSYFCNSGQDELAFCLADNCTINNASAVLFRKDFLARPGLVDDSLRFAGDWMVYIKLASEHAIAYIPNRLNYYRDHAANVSKNAEKQGDIFFERTCCLLAAHAGTKDTAQRQLIFRRIVLSYLDVINSTLKINKNPAQFYHFARRIARYNYSLFTRLQAAAVLQMGKIVFAKR